ncbi:MAG: hypothetical protein Q8K78_00400 [Planctomycetaceae bacterium]|nr:hypothetical protein [Planctomycetaceae bacterium]
MNALKFLQGKKTYIVVAGALIVTGVHLVGLIDLETTEMALVALGFGGLATLRAGIVNALKQAKEGVETKPPVA